MAGRPKRVFTEQQIEQIDEMALNNCKDSTIALVLGIPVNSLKRHFGRRMIQKRAEFRQELRDNQSKLAKTAPAMAIFLGKNELGQVDRQEVKHEMDEQRQLSEREKAEAKRLAKIRLVQGTG